MSEWAPNAEDERGEYFDPWEALGIRTASYSEQIDLDCIAVLKGIAAKQYCTDIAAANSLPPAYVELLQSLFCNAGWAEYGTSPRGCWPQWGTDFSGLIAAWEAYAERQWR